MNVFLTSATGYIGGAVAEALQAAGHQVIGLARSDESQAKLEAKGMRAHRGSITDPNSFMQVASEADAIIHTASTNGPDTPQSDRMTVEAVLAAFAGTNKTFIYTSGTWIYGNTGDAIATEASPLAPTPIVAFRPAIEQHILAAAQQGIRTIILRNALVYGRGGGVVSSFVKSAKEKGGVQFIGTGENRWQMVNVNDLADLYVLALEKAPAGTVLNAASGEAVKVRDAAAAAMRGAGVAGEPQSWPLEAARQVMGPLADALVLDQQISGARAKELLGWNPQLPSVLEDLERGSYV
ncbi:SDR family oxidoreductase [Pseudanabaena sp. PCC 6802]|uniref:SDR family oxidoreductase n=1 Tax=Pseudanabaena sp. PCC 6802 TaxID=118173 RepID=UPI00034CC4DF|nr:SDR family oxidoreductase [Pseudanabaena sp. PCC 6802]